MGYATGKLMRQKMTMRKRVLLNDEPIRKASADGLAFSHGDGPYILGSDPVAVAEARRELERDPSAKLGPAGATPPCMLSKGQKSRGKPISGNAHLD